MKVLEDKAWYKYSMTGSRPEFILLLRPAARTCQTWSWTSTVLFVFVCLQIIIFVSCGVIIERNENGDTFTSSGTICNKMDANCATSNDSYDGCTKCRCYKGRTYFNTPGKCYQNPSTTEVNCKFHLEGSQYNGQILPLLQLTYSNQQFGAVVTSNDHSKTHFSSCSLIADESVYWNSQQWLHLYSEGRVAADFSILRKRQNGGYAHKLKWSGGNVKAYEGLLIKLSLNCAPTGKSCLMFKIKGSKEYIFASTSVPATATSTIAATKFQAASTTVALISWGTNSTTTAGDTNIIEVKGGSNGTSNLIIIIGAVVVFLAFVAIIVFVFWKRRGNRNAGTGFCCCNVKTPESNDTKDATEGGSDAIYQTPDNEQFVKQTNSSYESSIPLNILPKKPKSPEYCYARDDLPKWKPQPKEPDYIDQDTVYVDPDILCNGKTKSQQATGPSYQTIQSSTSSLERKSHYQTLDSDYQALDTDCIRRDEDEDNYSDLIPDTNLPSPAADYEILEPSSPEGSNNEHYLTLETV